MNQLVPISSPALRALVAVADERAAMGFLEFFAANIRNPHTRRVYARAAEEFLTWCDAAGAPSIAAMQPVHVATLIKAGTRELAAPSVKQCLAAIRHLFDWLVTGQVMPVNPAGSVGRPRHVVTSGQTPVLDPAEARTLLDSIDTSTRRPVDPAELREKGGTRYAMPCHHNVEEYLVAYLDGAGLRGDPKGPLFRTIGRGMGQLTPTVCRRRTRMRSSAAARPPPVSPPNWATTASGVEKAAAMANRASIADTFKHDGGRRTIRSDSLFQSRLSQSDTEP
jgi:hypothetical protein